MMVLIRHMQMNRLLFMKTYLLETYIVVMSIDIFRRSCLVVHDAMVVRRFPPRGDCCNYKLPTKLIHVY